jgi:hypothetical protein
MLIATNSTANNPFKSRLSRPAVGDHSKERCLKSPPISRAVVGFNLFAGDHLPQINSPECQFSEGHRSGVNTNLNRSVCGRGPNIDRHTE